MHAPQQSGSIEVLASRQRASAEITRGIEEEIRALHDLSAFLRAREILFFALLYAAGALLAYASDDRTALLCLGIVCMGISLNALGILIHDGLHGLLAESPRKNHLLSFLIGLPLGISATAYQVTHTYHHYELGRKRDYGTYQQHLRSPMLVWIAYFLQLLFGTILYVIFIPLLAFAAASRRLRVFIVLEYCVIGAVFALVYYSVSWQNLLVYWGYPLLVMTGLTNVRGLGSHALGDVENIYQSSRTIQGSKLVTLLFLHENYHLEHHLFPRVPSYHLSKVHALVWDRLPEALYSRSYMHFLLGFFGAAMKRDLSPLGVVCPAKDNSPAHYIE